MAAQWSEPVKPNSAMPVNAEPKNSASIGACLHCGKATTTKFCCSGCESVHNYLVSEGLSQYYDLQTRLGRHAPTQSITDDSTAAKPPSDGDAEAFRYRGAPDRFAFYVPSLSCAACLWIVERVLSADDSALSGISGVRVDLDRRMIVVQHRAGKPFPLAEVLRRLKAVGYKPLPPRWADDDHARSATQRQALQNLGISGAIFGNVMLFATAVYFGGAWGMTDSMRSFFDGLSALLATLSLATAGRGFFATAWASLTNRILHVDLPIAFALALSYVVSIGSLVRGTGPVYFDSVTGLIFLLLVGRYLNDGLQSRARRLSDSAAALLPPRSARIRIGDVIDVAPGETIPADGEVIGGISEVGEAALTGEQGPVMKRPGEIVRGGTQNLNGALRVRVTSNMEDCQISRVAQLVKDAVVSKSRFETMASRWLPKFVGATFLAALVSAVVWWEKDPSQVLAVVTATLIVSCPCALALATPLLMAISMAKCWRQGAIVKSADAVESTAMVDAIVLDKTGTLTSGAVAVVGTFGPEARRDDLEALSAVVRRSRHPIARSLAAHCRSLLGDSLVELAETQEVPGQGLVAFGTHDGRPFRLRVGQAAFVAKLALPALPDELVARQIVHWAVAWDGGTPSQVARGFILEDSLDPEAPALIRRWQTEGIRVYLASGDSWEPTATVASSVGIPSAFVLARQTPADKKRLIDELTRAGLNVMMVGDGINDAAALATATVGVAVSGGVDLALSSADVFLGSPGIGTLAGFIRYCKYTRRTLAMILAFNVSYNIAAVALAISGVLHPLIAALIMPLASITIIAFALLRRGEESWKSSTSSCHWPSPSPVPRSSGTFGQLDQASSTT